MNAVWIERMMVRELTTLENEIAAAADDATLWTTPPGISNSIGNLTLHLVGNLQHFVGAVLGKTGYVRQRELEFSRRDVPRAELLAEIAESKRIVTATLGGERAIEFQSDYPELVGGVFRIVTGDFLIHLAVHLGFHVGQIGYLRRILTGGGGVPTVGPGALATARKIAT